MVSEGALKAATEIDRHATWIWRKWAAEIIDRCMAPAPSPGVTREQAQTCQNCGKPVFFHGDTWYHVNGSDVMSCGGPANVPARPENEPARDYDFHGNPPNLPARPEFAEVGNWLGEICGNCSEERREHAANGDGCLNAAGTVFEPTGRYTPPARTELDKDEGGMMCRGCDYQRRLHGEGSAIVRDMLARCSRCHARIMSIDYVHTCLGGELCESCYRASAHKVPSIPAPPICANCGEMMTNEHEDFGGDWKCSKCSGREKGEL